MARGGNIRLANKKVVSIRSFIRKGGGLAVISLVGKQRKPSKIAFPIKISRSISTTLASYVTVQENQNKVRFVQNKITRSCTKRSQKSKKLERIFKPFNARNHFCTLPAGFPSTTEYAGSPLVQYHQRKAYLVGLLTDLTSSSLPGASFGKYTKVGHVN